VEKWRSLHRSISSRSARFEAAPFLCFTVLLGLPHGKGKMTFADKSSFEGFWENGQYQYGTFVTSHGDEYLGSFCDNAFAGNGKMKYKSGEEYLGMACTSL